MYYGDNFKTYVETKNCFQEKTMKINRILCGERGIRTPDKLLTYTHFPGVLLQPLGHLSKQRTSNRRAQM